MPYAASPESALLALGRQVRTLRLKAGRSQMELAEAAGLHPTYLSGVERGRRNPTVTVLVHLAAALDVPVTELFRDLPAGIT